MTPELRTALDNAYQVFAHYEDDLHMARKCGINRPLHLITRDDWRKMDAEFDISTLLYSNYTVYHFLPLWMEWLVGNVDGDNNLPHLWPNDFSHLLNRSGWLHWPPIEVDAVRRVLEAWTNETLASPVGKMFPDFLLEIEESVDRYFDLWLEARPLEVANWLVEQDWVHPRPALLQWVIRPCVEEKLEAAFWVNPEGEHAELLSRAVQLLRSIRASKAGK